MQKPTPEYCYIVCEECGARELANLGNKACIVCHWRLTGEGCGDDRRVCGCSE